ncbi:energy transducer TonB [Granulicella sp. WH15]|uniref:energy transducer TonB n=1 Tax=Granulicella sp. WH15 TaxID=2602070 RepID=UPI0013A58BD7|nr:energy transducer TonB [Granulicella sp. WH15]
MRRVKTNTLGKLLLPLVFLISPMTWGRAESSAALHERLHRVAQGNVLDDASLQPWHLKMTVQLYDSKGSPSESGTLEEWWGGAQKDRQIFTTPSYTATIVHNEHGLFLSTGASLPPALLEQLRKQVVHPMPSDHEVDQSTPDLHHLPLGGVDLDCVMLTQTIKGVAFAPLGLFPTYCMSRGEDTLRVSYEFGNQLTLRVRTGAFQSRHVPLDTSIQIAGVQAASAHIDKLESVPEQSVNSDVIDGLTSVNGATAEVDTAVMAGHVLHKVAPIYPDRARKGHISGTVLLHVIIGTDGHVHDLSVISAPDPELAIAAIAAVRQWTYTPYINNGEPASVDTKVTVNFNFAPR